MAQKDDEELFDEYEEMIINVIDALEDDLMGTEMKLQDTLGAATVDFQDRVKKLLDDMKLKTQN